MSGSLIGGVVGAIIGYVVSGFNPAGAMYGFSLGSMAGGLLFPPELPTAYGPRLDDLHIQVSEYGVPLPIVYGTVALQGCVIWGTDLVEVETATEQGGGSGGGSQTTISYAYYANFAVAICEGPVTGVLRIWAGPEKRLIYDGFSLEGGSIRIYLGTEDQMPDALIEADKGVGGTPAFRGTCYVVFEDYPVAKDGNRIPFLTFEVSTASAGIGENYSLVDIGSGQFGRLYDPAPEHILTHSAEVLRGSAQDPFDGKFYVTTVEEGGAYLHRIDLETKEVDSLLVGTSAADIMALNTLDRTVAVFATNQITYTLVDLETFTASFGVPTPNNFAKCDLIFSEKYGGFAWLNYNNEYIGPGSPPPADPDNWGRFGAVAGGRLIDCDGDIAAVSPLQPTTINRVSTGVNRAFEIFDPVARRLISFSDGCYLELGTGALVEVIPATESPLNLAYNPYLRRIIGATSEGMAIFDPATFNEGAGFPVEAIAFAGTMLYSADPADLVQKHFSLAPVFLPNDRTHMAFVDQLTGAAPEGDVFLFRLGVLAGGMPLSEVVADLNDRAGVTSYDVNELAEDMVQGYAIARPVEVRGAIDSLRPAYFFDAVESQGVVRFVKRGGATAAEIPDEDLGARDAGSEAPDPLKTTRLMEVEMPRAVTVKYMLAADEYAIASKHARRLVGASGDEKTIEVPLVLTDTKAQEVAEANLHGAWVERLSYEFSLPRKYTYLEPTDLITVRGNLMRLVSMKATPRGVFQCAAVADDSQYYLPHVVVTETPPTIKEVMVPGTTRLELF